MTAVDTRLDHLAIASAFAAAPEQWPVAPRFNPLDRWYHRLHVADDHEVWLLTWLPGQGTEWHDHGGSAGAFHVFSGTLTEDTVTVADGTQVIQTASRTAGASNSPSGSRAPSPCTTMPSPRDSVTRGSFCRRLPEAALRGFIYVGLPCSTSIAA